MSRLGAPLGTRGRCVSSSAVQVTESVRQDRNMCSWVDTIPAKIIIEMRGAWKKAGFVAYFVGVCAKGNG